MARRSFYSFHYVPDNWRAGQVRNMGVVDGNVPVSDNDWEKVKGGGDAAIKKWIAEQLAGRSCTIVLVGAGTAGRKWISYEISESWKGKKGVVGVHIHNLKDKDKKQSAKGGNPLASVPFGTDGKMLSSVAKVYDPPYVESTDVYDYIKNDLSAWAEEAVSIRAKYP